MGLDNGAVGADRKRRMQPGAAHGKIVGRRGVGIIAGEHIAHIQLHRLTGRAELSQTSAQTQRTLNLDLQFYVAHTVLVEMRYGIVDLSLFYA